MLSFLTRPWYRRLFKQEWISWEIVATKEQIRYFVWVPDKHIGSAFKSKYYAEHPEVEIVEVTDRIIDFSRPHAATKLFTESHWTIPIKTYHNEVVDTQAELIEFLDGLEDGQEVHDPLYSLLIIQKRVLGELFVSSINRVQLMKH